MHPRAPPRVWLRRWPCSWHGVEKAAAWWRRQLAQPPGTYTRQRECGVHALSQRHRDKTSSWSTAADAAGDPWQTVPVDSRHLLRRAGKAQHQVRHASIDERLQLLQTLLWRAKDTIAFDKIIEWLVITPGEIGNGHLLSCFIISGNDREEQHATLDGCRFTAVGWRQGMDVLQGLLQAPATHQIAEPAAAKARCATQGRL